MNENLVGGNVSHVRLIFVNGIILAADRDTVFLNPYTVHRDVTNICNHLIRSCWLQERMSQRERSLSQRERCHELPAKYNKTDLMLCNRYTYLY